jgi:beta-hydroxylase
MSFLDPYHITPLLDLAKNWEVVRSEYDRIQDKATQWPEPIHNGQWDVIGLRFMGRDLDRQSDAPTTTELCRGVPGIETFGFSIMRPGCRIKPHRGYTDSVLRIHLGLHVNHDAAIKVGTEQKTWSEGGLLMFDDTQTHSAWNLGTVNRVILLLDAKRSAILQ